MKIKVIKMQINFVLFVVLAVASSATAQTNPPGFLSIDCGAANDYYDTDLKLPYKSDDDFISTGENMQVSPEVINDDSYRKQSKNMRIFPNGTRNCYKLSPDKGKQNTYLIRASFWYANYDGLNRAPSFDLYIDVNYWATVNEGYYVWQEIFYVPPRDDIQLCLVNTGSGVPFISAIELRLLDNSTYRIDSGALVTSGRYDIGGPLGSTIGYPDDVYDRVWPALNNYNWSTIAANTTVDDFTTYNDAYKVPASVLTTAASTTNSMRFSWPLSYPTQKWYFYFHFAEFQVLQQNQTREFGVYALGKLVSNGTVRPKFGRPVTVAYFPVPSSTEINFSITATAVSNLPPILNAFEIMYSIDLTESMTALDDVKAMNDIKTTYDVRRDSWQGDPCSPRTFSWDRLNCSYDNTPRIISLNLSSSKLVGKIANSISNLTTLTSLDLSDNQLTENIPEFLGDLPNLKFLILTGNNLSGPIPEALKRKIKAGTLQAIFDADLCQSGACATSSSGKKKNNAVLPVVPALISLAVLIVLVGFSLFLWRNKIKQLGGNTAPVSTSTGLREVQIGVARNQTAFTSSEIATITNNYGTVIGQGGYGKVYLGSLYNGTKVAVKMLSKSSSQGYKEFQAEVQLLMVVHHRNLVSLVGYCDEVESMALIYEFMSHGNLRQHLSENNDVLSWSERLQIAVDAAQGLEYLHNGCKPPIIHRDFKTSNILINESMQAKIADFGLSKAFASDTDSHISTIPAGTPGYLDPGFQATGNLTKKSDVYSFGIVLFELITGHPVIIRSERGSMHIIAWVTPHIENGDIQSIVDPRLNGRFSISSAWKAVEIAMSCVPTSSHMRPDMNRVLSDLKDCLGVEIASARNEGINAGSSSTSWRSSSFDMTAPNAR